MAYNYFTPFSKDGIVPNHEGVTRILRGVQKRHRQRQFVETQKIRNLKYAILEQFPTVSWEGAAIRSTDLGQLKNVHRRSYFKMYNKKLFTHKYFENLPTKQLKPAKLDSVKIKREQVQQNQKIVQLLKTLNLNEGNGGVSQAVQQLPPSKKQLRQRRRRQRRRQRLRAERETLHQAATYSESTQTVAPELAASTSSTQTEEPSRIVRFVSSIEMSTQTCSSEPSTLLPPVISTSSSFGNTISVQTDGPRTSSYPLVNPKRKPKLVRRARSDRLENENIDVSKSTSILGKRRAFSPSPEDGPSHEPKMPKGPDQDAVIAALHHKEDSNRVIRTVHDHVKSRSRPKLLPSRHLFEHRFKPF